MNIKKQSKYNKEWRHANPERIRIINLRYRENVKSDPEKLKKRRRDNREYAREWRKNNKDKLKIARKKYRKKHPENSKWRREYEQKPSVKIILKARSIAKRKIKIVECKNCGSVENLNRHHSDYNKPLNVIVLCEDCHQEWHRSFKAVQPILNINEDKNN